MKAIVLNEIKCYPSFEQNYKEPELDRSESLVKLAYAALNRRDFWITQGMYPNIKTPTILGSDGAGRIGDRRVLIHPAIHWGDNKRVQGHNYQPLGMPKDGTLAEYIALSDGYIFDTPDFLNDAEAACIGMAGLTAYRALFSRGELKSGDRVLINGVGGGVALMACQFAIAAGAEVYVTSSANEKIENAIKLGAKNGFNYKSEDWHKKAIKAGHEFDIIVDSAGGSQFNHLVEMAAPGCRIVTYGGTQGTIQNINAQILFWRQVSILGTTMGSPTEFRKMLNFIAKFQIHPVIHKLYYWDDVTEAFDTMKYGKQFGKLVFSLE